MAQGAVYSYTVKAIDEAGNSSNASNTVNIAINDTQAPTTPANLSVSLATGTSVSLSWSASSDNVSVIRYDVYRGGLKVGSSTSTRYTDTGLAQGSAYSYTVKAIDEAGNSSNESNSVAITIKDTQAPTSPVDLSSSPINETSVSLSWTASTDNIGVIGYNVHNGTELIGSTAETVYTVPDLIQGNTYYFTVKAIDAAGNISAASNAVTVRMLDISAPTAPENLICTAVSETTAELSWTASTDNIGIADYSIYDGTTFIGSSSISSYTVTGLMQHTTYAFTVKARDAAGNLSPASNEVSITTNSVDKTAPANLTCASKTCSTASLIWTAPADTNGLIGYEIFNNEMLITETIDDTTCTVDRLMPDQIYTFNIKAKYSDKSKNAASSSSITVKTDPDTTNPTTPQGVYAYSKQDTQLIFKWSPSSDDSYIALYEIYRNGIKVGTSGIEEYTDTGLTKTTTYVYKVRAIDAAGNKSGYSSTTSIPTLADDHGNEYALATPISLEANMDGNISYSGDVDFFRFKPTVSGRYTIISSGSTDVHGYLLNEYNKVINESSNIS